MKKTITLWILIFLGRTVIAQDATVIYKNTVNSTVTIETDIKIGSGFFVSENVIATNYHVIEGASEAYCYTNNSSTKYKIEGYLAVDKSVDLILLKVSGLDRAAIKLATNPVSPGQKIFVIGSPKGLPASISDGIISGLRDFDGIKLIQITAPISPGSSGGPVLNTNGEVIGVSVGQYKDGQNLNFAIPESNLELLLTRMTSSTLSISKLYNKFGSFTDNRDGETYKTIKIGTQVWMAENLKTTSFNDGLTIPLITDNNTWAELTTPAYCWYNNDEATYKPTYGALYNWYAVNTSRLCPIGWHVPTDNEWKTLEMFLGMSQSEADSYSWRGTIEGSKIKETGTIHWKSPNEGATNESGFTALPGGCRESEGIFNDVRSYAYWWSATEFYDWKAFHRTAGLFLNPTRAGMERFYANKEFGYSIRCVKD